MTQEPKCPEWRAEERASDKLRAAKQPVRGLINHRKDNWLLHWARREIISGHCSESYCVSLTFNKALAAVLGQ